MTYPEGREPLSWDDVMGVKHVSHPSTWEAECAALREQNTELALQVLASGGQAEEAYQAQLSAESAASWANIKAEQAITEAKALRARVQELEAFAKECASYTCTCHEGFVGRQMVNPSCMAGEIGYLAQEVLGQPITCRGILAARPRWAALQKQEGE